MHMYILYICMYVYIIPSYYCAKGTILMNDSGHECTRAELHVHNSYWIVTHSIISYNFYNQYIIIYVYV